MKLYDETDCLPHVKPAPREWWVTLGDGFCWNSKDDAEHAGDGEIVHVREVLADTVLREAGE